MQLIGQYRTLQLVQINPFTYVLSLQYIPMYGSKS